MAYDGVGQYIPGAQPVELEEFQRKSLAGFNLLGGEINWQAVEDVAEYLEINDIELFIDNLITLKDYQANNK